MSLPYLKRVLVLLHEDVVVSMKGMSSSMCLDVTIFMKDNMNARKDLAALCE
jgi:hypothetical protein